jgi:hypothetical protein
MPPKKFVCKRCGRCCTEISGGYQNSISRNSLHKWIKDAPSFVHECIVHLCGEIYDYFISPTTGNYVNRCPWFRCYKADRYKHKGSTCIIHKYKPPICIGFPKTIAHALECKCEGFNHLSEEEITILLKRERKKQEYLNAVT